MTVNYFYYISKMANKFRLKFQLEIRRELNFHWPTANVMTPDAINLLLLLAFR